MTCTFIIGEINTRHFGEIFKNCQKLKIANGFFIFILEILAQT